MSNTVRYKSIEISLICYIVVGLILWVGLFVLSPKYPVFTVNKEQLDKMPNTENGNIILNDIKDLKPKDFNIFMSKEIDAKNSQNVVGRLVLIYGMAGFIFVCLNGRKIVHKVYLPLILSLFSILYLIANAYYDITFKPFNDFFKNFSLNFIFIKSLPFIVLIYALLRLLVLKISGKELNIVGKYEVFRDPLSWLFTIIVIGISFYLGDIAPWF